MIARTAGQLGELGSRRSDPRVAFAIRKRTLHPRCDVEIVAHQRHAEGGVQFLEKDAARFRNAVTSASAIAKCGWG